MNPFHVEPLRDAILRKEARSWLEAHFGDLVAEYRLTRRPLTPRDSGAIRQAFLQGSEAEMLRLSRTTDVPFRLDTSVLNEGSRQWWSAIKRADIDTCSLVEWRNVLLNSFEMGAQFVSHYLFPPPEERAVMKPRRRRR